MCWIISSIKWTSAVTAWEPGKFSFVAFTYSRSASAFDKFDILLLCLSWIVLCCWQKPSALAHVQSGTHRHITVIGSVCARRRRPCSMFLEPNTWPSVAMRSVQLQLVCGTVCQRQCSLLSHCTFFDAAWKLHCSRVLTTDTAPCQTTLLLRDSLLLSRSFLSWPHPWSLSTTMLLWHSFLIKIIIIITVDLPII